MKRIVRSLMYLLLVCIPILEAYPGNSPLSVETIKSINASIYKHADSICQNAAQQLLNAKHDSSRIKAYYALGACAYQKHLMDSSESCFTKGLELAITLPDSTFIAYLNYKLGAIYSYRGQPIKAKKFFSEAYETAVLSRNNFNKAYVLNGLALTATEMGDFESSERFFRDGIVLAQLIEDKKLEWILSYGLTESLCFQHKYAAGFEEGIRSLYVARELNDSSLVAKSNMSIGILHTQNKDFQKAIGFFNEAKRCFTANGDQYWSGVVFNNLSKAFLANAQTDSAIYYANKAKVLFEQINIPRQIISVYCSLSSIYLEEGKLDSALHFAQKVLTDFSSDDAPPIDLSRAYHNIGNCFLLQKRYNRAIKYAEKGLDLLQNNEDLTTRLDFYHLLTTCYKKTGNSTKAFYYSELKYETSEKFRDVNEAKKIATLDANHRHEKEKLLLIASQSQLDMQKKEAILQEHNKSELIIPIMIAAFIITLVLLKMYCAKRSAIKEMAQNNEAILCESERLKEVNNLKSVFFTKISHEFRTPLTLISGPAHLLRNQLKGENAKQMDSIINNTKRLLQLVNQILELAELQNNKQPLQLSKTLVQPFIQQVASNFEPLAESRGIQFKCSISTESDCFINAVKPLAFLDHENIEKILTNLLSNAFKFSPDKSTIELNALYTNSKLKLTIKDTGIGMTPAEQEHIFDMFYYTKSEHSASSGIGLSMVNTLVKNNGGKIEVISEKGKGSTFKVTIPTDLKQLDSRKIPYEIINEEIADFKTREVLEKPEESKIEEIGETETIESDAPQPDTIMVVDDNEEIRHFIADLLGTKFSIITAADGKEGVDKAREFIPDLILSDVMMPNKDGFELVKELKQDEKTSHIPIILLTAKGDQQSKIEGLSLKADDYLTKPFDQHELMIRIDNLVRNRKMMQDKFSQDLIFNHQEISGPSTNQILMERILMAVEERIDDSSLSVDELAKIVGLSRSQLHRKIVAMTGKSTSIFIRNIRLRMAHEMLKNQIGNISEISYKVGFSSPSYFNRCFKEMYGVPPSTILNQHTGKTDNIEINPK